MPSLACELFTISYFSIFILNFKQTVLEMNNSTDVNVMLMFGGALSFFLTEPQN